MKKGIAALAGLLTVLLVGTTAYADVIWSPMNDFLSAHYRECAELYRSYTANGEVPAYREPGSSELVGKAPDGSQYLVAYTYTLDGEVWGVIELAEELVAPQAAEDEPRESSTLSGWVLMDQMTVVYDFVSFQEEHKQSFHPFAGDADAICNAEKAVGWTWPGSGVHFEVHPAEMKEAGEDLEIQYAYTDIHGREWVFLDYVPWERNVWICASDPLATDLPVAAYPNQGAQPAGPTPATGHMAVPVTAIVLVASLVVGTAVLIRVFWKPERQAGGR